MKRFKTRLENIFVNENGVHYYRGKPPGSRRVIERSLKTNDLNEAKQKRDKLLSKISEIGSESKKAKCKNLLQQYLLYRNDRFNSGSLKLGTLKQDQYIIEKFLIPFFGRDTIDLIDDLGFEQYCDKYGPRDFQNHRNVITSFLKWCKKRRFIKHVQQFEIPDWERRQRAVLTKSEIVELFKNANGNLLLFISMYLFMGMRSSEITKLEWSRVDLEKATIYLSKKDTKTNRQRELPINSFVLNLLKHRYRSNPYVFPNKRGLNAKKGHMDPTGFKKEWAKLLQKSKIDRHITPHDMRATWETYTHLNPNFTDTQREKMAGASIAVQKNIYVSMTADDLRGLEEAVQFDDLSQVLQLRSKGETLGK